MNFREQIQLLKDEEINLDSSKESSSSPEILYKELSVHMKKLPKGHDSKSHMKKHYIKSSCQPLRFFRII